MAYRVYSDQRDKDKVRYNLMESIGVLGQRDNGWTREVNIVSWNGGKPKVDIREWDPEHTRMTKGITLFEEEAERLTKLLARRYGFRFAYPDRSVEAAEEEIPFEAAGGRESNVAESAAEDEGLHADEASAPCDGAEDGSQTDDDACSCGDAEDACSREDSEDAAESYGSTE